MNKIPDLYILFFISSLIYKLNIKIDKFSLLNRKKSLFPKKIYKKGKVTFFLPYTNVIKDIRTNYPVKNTPNHTINNSRFWSHEVFIFWFVMEKYQFYMCEFKKIKPNFETNL